MTERPQTPPVATESLCPHCLARIPAERRQEGHDLVLTKVCPEHGEFHALLWRGGPAPAGWSRPKQPVRLGRHNCREPRGCPFDCGICPEHRQQSCTVLIEVTGRCNLACAYCFADSGKSPLPDPSLEALAGRLSTALAAGGPENILQLSGGEPTLRDDLPAIVRLARETGFPHVQLNTNGIRLAAERGYAAALREAGLFSVFLQFDGTREWIYEAIRGRPLLAEKLRAIERCAESGLGVVLVPTLVPGVNTQDVGAILKLALTLAPAVRGVHFQPASHFGRHPHPPVAAARFTLPDLMTAIEEQTDGLMRVGHFRPPGCEHPLCSFHGNFLRHSDGGVQPLSGHGPTCCGGKSEPAGLGTGKAVSFVARQWAAPAADCCREDAGAPPSLDEFVERHRANTFAVSAMAFQDVWNIDLERAQECCIHVAAPDGRMIPFCLYNLTSAEGVPLYRRTTDVAHPS